MAIVANLNIEIAITLSSCTISLVTAYLMNELAIGLFTLRYSDMVNLIVVLALVFTCIVIANLMFE